MLALGKRLRQDAHTVLAAGGINAALGSVDPQDSWEQHFADTVREGYFLGHPRMVEILARESPRAVLELAEWGCPFARTPEGRLDQRFFGAHTYRRTCYAGDYTGRAVLTTLARPGGHPGHPHPGARSTSPTSWCTRGSASGPWASTWTAGSARSTWRTP